MDSTATILTQANEVNAHILVLTTNCVEDWFADRRLDTEDFIDRLCGSYLNNEDIDIEKLDTPAVKKIMRHARRVKSELE